MRATSSLAVLVVAALCAFATRARAAPSEPDRDYGGTLDVPSMPIAPDDAASKDDVEALRLRVEQLEARERARERATAPVTAPPALPRREIADGEVGFGPAVTPAQYGLRLGGFLQVQYRHDQLSEDQYQQGGTPLNRDGFAVRRGRLRVSGDWKWIAFAFELDGSTTRGPFVGVRQAHVSGVWRNENAALPPYLMLTAGLTEVPFGYELRLPQRDMMFMERSTGSLALFPGPVDVGVRLRGAIGPFRYDVAAMNGSPLDDVAGGARFDPTRRPDLVGRVGATTKPRKVVISGGASYLHGTGLHQGQDATKNQLEWIDLNENGSIDSAETFTVPGTAALPSVRFGRWAIGADVQAALRTKIGWTRVLGEVTIAQNLDRGLFVADPFARGSNLRHLQAYGAVLQDLTRWAVIGLRYDVYDYDSDLLTRTRGRAVPADPSIHSISPLVGAILPAGVLRPIRGRLVLQYDIVLDALGRDARGVPANLRNDRVTVRAQIEF